MHIYRGDLHIHTQLSPCGSLENSPGTIIETALKKHLDFIGIADHNTTRQAPLVKRMAAEKGLTVFTGIEINSREEVHCLAFFETEEQLMKMQAYVDQHLPSIPNNPDYFGYQVVVDNEENIVYTEERMLHTALEVGIDDICRKVHEWDGIFIPAHIDRRGNGLISQLGFLPEHLPVDGLEVFRMTDAEDLRKKQQLEASVCLIKNSDAHYPEDIGKAFTIYEMEELNFENLRKTLKENRVSLSENNY